MTFLLFDTQIWQKSHQCPWTFTSSESIILQSELQSPWFSKFHQNLRCLSFFGGVVFTVILQSHIYFNSYSMLFIEDRTSFHILASCKTFHGGVFSWLSASATWVIDAYVAMALCVWDSIHEVSQSKVGSLQETELPLSLLCVCALWFLFFVFLLRDPSVPFTICKHSLL